MKVIGIVGLKNSGKTFFAQKIISGLTSRELEVAAIKHAHDGFEIDHPQTDSFLHRKAGAKEVIISSSKRWAKITEIKNKDEKKLNELLKEVENADIVIVEGYKNDIHPKIEIIKNSSDKSAFLFNKLKNVIAVISEQKIDLCEKKQFKKNEINEIIEFIINYNDK